MGEIWKQLRSVTTALPSDGLRLFFFCTFFSRGMSRTFGLENSASSFWQQGLPLDTPKKSDSSEVHSSYGTPHARHGTRSRLLFFLCRPPRSPRCLWQCRGERALSTPARPGHPVSPVQSSAPGRASVSQTADQNNLYGYFYAPQFVQKQPRGRLISSSVISSHLISFHLRMLV